MTKKTNTKKHKLNHSLGQLTSLKSTETGLQGHTTYGLFNITVYNSGIIRVHVRFAEHTDTNPYSVVAQPQANGFEVSDEDTTIKLKTELLVLEITKNPVRFTFKNHEGAIINEDDSNFGTSIIGEQITTYKKLQEGERFIGMGEKTGPLDRRGSGYQHWNTDSFGYHSSADPLYCSTPFYIGVHHHLAYGIFLNNSHKSHFNFGASNDRFSSISADAGDMDYFFIYEQSVAGILKNYALLTGFTKLPPIWSIGYQQCRYSYYPDLEVMQVARTFREKNIPADVIVLDIHYMEKYKIFTWDNKNFSNPKELLAYLHDLGFHVVVMCDPGIKIEEGYDAYHTGKEQDVFVKYPDGSYYSGSVWPGLCHFPDFTKPETRKWWQENLDSYAQIGVDGYWNDMNEIATWGQMLPELIEFDFEGDPATGRKGRNVYGMQMSKATFEGAKANLKGKRPFNLTRAGFAGIQRYAAVWTGDNVASDEHMMLGVRLVNSLGLAGVAFAGYDVGGFVGNASEHLFARWCQIGAFAPFFRGHTMINSRDSEPWAYGEQVEEISRNFIKLRYKLMPYLYASFYETSQSGIPVARSLAIDYTFDANIYNGQFENQYLFGQSILVAPVESYKTLTKVYLPKGKWYELFTDTQYDGNQQIVAECGIERLPVFVKASAIIPVSSKAHTNTKNLGDTIEIHVYAGEEENSFLYYEDDGETYQFEQGKFHKRLIEYNPQSKSIIINKAEGQYASRFKHLHVCFHGFDANQFDVEGEHMIAENHMYRFIDPISNFDPFGNETGEGLRIDALQSIKMAYSNQVITVKW